MVKGKFYLDIETVPLKNWRVTSPTSAYRDLLTILLLLKVVSKFNHWEMHRHEMRNVMRLVYDSSKGWRKP